MAFTITRGRTFANNEILTPTKLNQAGVPTLEQATQTLLGRQSAGTGPTEEISPTQGRSILGLSETDKVQFGAIEANPSEIASASSIALDFAGRDVQYCALAHNPTFTTANRAIGRAKRVRLSAGASSRTLTFSEAWKWLNIASVPSTLPANKIAELFLFCYGNNATDVVAYWAVQA